MRNWKKYHSAEDRARRSQAARHAAEIRWAAVHANGENADDAYQRAKRAPHYGRITIEGFGPTIVINLSRSQQHCRQWDCTGGLDRVHSATEIGRAIARAISWR